MPQTAAQSSSGPPLAPAEEEAAPLEQRIEELLTEINETSESVTDILREEDAALHPPEPAAVPAPPVADTATPTINAPATPDADATPAPEAAALEPALVDAPIAELEASIDRVIQDAQRTLGEPTEPTADTSGTFAQVDEALAENADAMMASADVGAVRALSEPASTTAPEPAHGEPDHAPVDAIANAVVPVVVSAPPEPLEVSGAAVGGDNPSHQTTKPRKNIRLIEVASWPMACLPVVVRDLVGWFALVTIFNAACIWVYLII